MKREEHQRWFVQIVFCRCGAEFWMRWSNVLKICGWSVNPQLFALMKSAGGEYRETGKETLELFGFRMNGIIQL